MVARADSRGRPRIDHRAFRRNDPNHAIESLVDGKVRIERSLDAKIDRRHQMRIRNVLSGRQLRATIAEIEFETAFADYKRHREPHGFVVDAVFVQPIDRVISAGPQS